MKLTLSPQKLKYLVLASGVLGTALRWLLYATGTDHKGLLVAGHWAHTALWALTAVTAALILYATRDLKDPERCDDEVNGAGALGCLAAAVCLAVTALRDLAEPAGAMPPVAGIAALAGAGCLLAVAFCRLAGRRPDFLLHVAVCLAFAVRMLCLYRYWRSDPQLQDYFFYMLAYITLTITAYNQAALDWGLGGHRKLWRFSLWGVYCCLVSLRGSRAPLLLVAAAAWAFTNLTNLNPRQRRQRPALNLEEEP